MGKVGLDFGTGNTVLARFNETLQQALTLEIPGITTSLRYRLRADAPEQLVNLVPSLIHYSETETLIGDQVLSRGLADHPDTFRWMKRAIAQGSTKRKKTAQGFKSAHEAGSEFLRLLLNYVSDQVDLTEDELTFTAPVEAFEDFTNWLRTVAESVGIGRLRIVDEPTACVLGYHGTVRRDDRFAVFDFGCGTLDVSAVSVDMMAAGEKKATQLGQSGLDLGGMDLDQWLADDFCQRHSLSESMRRELESVILRQAEQTKMTLSDPVNVESDMSVLLNIGSRTKLLRTTYRRTCDTCERGRRPSTVSEEPGCFGCLLVAKELRKRSEAVLEQAIENASVKVGMRKSDITKLLVTGGTSLVPCVQGLLTEKFDGRTELENPFDAVARGACRGIVVPILQHDYSLLGYDAVREESVFLPLFKAGTEFPTDPDDAVKLWCAGTADGQTRVSLKIYEVSQVTRRSLDKSIVDESGNLRAKESRLKTDKEYRFLNRANPTFIVANPPVDLKRDVKRFACRFDVDGQRRLLVTVRDKLSGELLLSNHPVVRL